MNQLNKKTQTLKTEKDQLVCVFYLFELYRHSFSFKTQLAGL